MKILFSLVLIFSAGSFAMDYSAMSHAQLVQVLHAKDALIQRQTQELETLRQYPELAGIRLGGAEAQKAILADIKYARAVRARKLIKGK